MAHLLAVVVASAIASDCAGLRCVFAGNTTWAGDGLQATLSIDPAAASDASGRAPATLQLSGTGGTHVLAGRAAWDASAREMLVEAEDGSWLALSSAVAPTTLLLHLGGFPAAPALTGSVHALDWQRPLPRGELANFAAAAAALGRGDAFVAGSLGGMGGSVLIQSLEDGSCLLSGEPSALNDASPNGQSRVDRPLLGPCDAAEALWTVGAGSSRGVRSLASIRSTCLRRRTLSRSRKPLTLGSCGSRGSRRWSVLHSGHLASARLLPNNSLGRLIGNWTRQPAQFCLRVSRPSDAAAARAWASCHARPACRAQGLVGACCPTEDGDFLPCCNATAPPVEAGLETAPCDAAGGFLLRVLPAPGLAPRAAMGGGAGGVAGKEEGGRAAGKQGGRESDALSDGQFAMLRAALEPASRRQLATGGDSRGTLAALLAGVPGLAGQGGWGAGSQAVVPWARFVEAVVSSQRSALAAADAAAGAAKAAAAAATHNASSTAADIGRRLAEAEAKAVAEAAARSAAENRLAEASRAAAANGAELAEAAQREEELRAAAARAKAYAESLAERTAAAERESLAASARVGEVEAQVDGAQHACNATRDRLAEIEAEVITARAAARKAEAALAIAAAEADGASRHEGTAREQVLEAVGRAAACEARVADEWRSQADCEAAGVAREVAEARLLRLTEKARADADSLRECRAAEAGHAQVAADATACAEARQALTTEVSLLRASLGARGEALAAAMASEAQAVSAAGVAQEKERVVASQLEACRHSQTEAEANIATLQLQVSDLLSTNHKCATALEASLLSANASTGDLGTLLRLGARHLILADADAARRQIRFLRHGLYAGWAARVPAPWHAFATQARERFAAAATARSAAAAAVPAETGVSWLVPLRPAAYAFVLQLVALILLAWGWRRASADVARHKHELELQTQRVQVVRTQRRERLQMLSRAGEGQAQLEMYLLKAEEEAEEGTGNGREGGEPAASPTASPARR